MSAHDLAIDGLLGLGAGIELLCCAGVLLARDTLDRLHYSAAAATLGPVLIAAAILIDESLSSSGITTLVVVAFLIALGPGLTIATARATHPRHEDRVLRLGEPEEEPG